MPVFFAYTLKVLKLIASAGGGGSSSGGGGGGSVIFLIGYVPMHLVGAFFRKAKKEKWLFDGLEVVGWIIAALYAVALTWVVGFFGFLAGGCGFLGMSAGLYGWFGKLHQSKKTKQALLAAEQQDGAWDEQKLIAHGKDVFMRYQQDWSNYNTESMKAYMTPAYQYHAALMIYALQLASRRDLVNRPVISQAMIVGVDNEAENDKDQVIIGFTAKANDQLIDTRSNQILFTDNTDFTESWRFRRSGNTWLLDGIQPATASQWIHNTALEQFAAAQGYYFSLDWGWLLLPAHGQLFGEGKFGVADINNHVIGVYNNKCLVQLYTYSSSPQAQKIYLIAQTSVPKSYGDIVVRHKSGLHLFGIRGLNRVTMEWPDFNKKYEVFASNVEQVTSFELLDPVFMEQLEALPFEVNIEVVDNVVYLYAPQKTVPDAGRYQVMLDILYRAFQQMRL
jgi:Protein of unknown function (DUF3137)